MFFPPAFARETTLETFYETLKIGENNFFLGSIAVEKTLRLPGIETSGPNFFPGRPVFKG